MAFFYQTITRNSSFCPLGEAELRILAKKMVLWISYSFMANASSASDRNTFVLLEAQTSLETGFAHSSVWDK